MTSFVKIIHIIGNIRADLCYGKLAKTDGPALNFETSPETTIYMTNQYRKQKKLNVVIFDGSIFITNSTKKKKKIIYKEIPFSHFIYSASHTGKELLVSMSPYASNGKNLLPSGHNTCSFIIPFGKLKFAQDTRSIYSLKLI